ncbi:hypothetical protein GCM10010517_16630 [Streptosporangium fragile]|uniref:Uncharacterized protein n=1 Tax=Streptosporangium fragile TaxID=46186 RepID=A0ABN3VTZ2_9ACTN
MTTTMSVSDLARVLFASPLQASENPSPDQVRVIIEDRIRACHEDLSGCTALVAQEAGDHPEAYETRMRWALREADRVYPVLASAT